MIPSTRVLRSRRTFIPVRGLLLAVAALISVPAMWAQTDATPTGQSSVALPGERPQNILSPEMMTPVRPFHGVRYKANVLGAAGPRIRNGSATPTCSSPHLSYFGGPVISHVQSVPVFWNSDVNSTIKANMPQFLADVANSTYMTALSEYGTYGTGLGSTQTDQVIGNGTASPGYTIIPLKCKAGSGNCTLQDSDIQTELEAQIAASTLPAPTYDSKGNSQTLYMIFFPPSVTVDAFGATSCQQFCAYHNTGLINNHPLLYGVLMDEFVSQCSFGCGSESTALKNSTNTASHEFAEAITDADVGLDTQNNYANPAAWGDNNNNCGEIGDICDSGAGDTITVSGRSWTVQELWSNTQGKCVSSGTVTAPFAVGGSGSATAATPYSFTVTAKNPTGGTNTAYSGTIHITSSDADAGLPSDYTFTASDSGVHTFNVTFQTAGTQSVTATDDSNADLTGSGSVTVAGDVAATLTSPSSGTTLPGPKVTFTWSAGSGATGYVLRLGTTVGGNNLYGSGVITATSVTPTHLPTNGETIYARLFTYFGSTLVHSDYSFTAATAAALTAPAPSATLPGPKVTFSWSAGTGATGYAIRLGTTSGGNDLYGSGPIGATSVTRTNLPTNGETIYARLFTYFGSSQVYTDYSLTAATAAALTAPTSGTTLAGPKVTFTWSAGTGATNYALRLGTTLGGNDLYGSGLITATSVTRTNLPTNGETFYARLFTYFGSSMVYTDYTFTAATASVLTSPAPPNSTLPGASVTFAWSTATGGVTNYVLWLGTTPGAKDLYTTGATAATSVTRNNMPTNGETIYVRLYTLYGSSQVYTDYVFTAASTAP